MDAQLARMRLESEGVPAFVLWANQASVDWLISNAIGGIQVQVPPSEVARARQILEDNPVVAERPAETCPVCGSSNVHRSKWSWRLSMLSTNLLAIPLPFDTSRLKCESCGHAWKAD
jgi:hypothetical protein